MALSRIAARFQGPPAPTGLTSNSPLLGISLKLASTFAFFVMVSALKIAADAVPIGQIVFSRNFFGIFPVLVMVGMRRELGLAVATRNPKGHLVRAAVGLSAMVCGFTSVSLLPLPDATAIGFATPLMVVVFAFFLLGEQVRVYRWSAVAVGFLGILVVLSTHLGEGGFDGPASLGAATGTLGACFAALAMISVRKLCQSERTSTIVTWFAGTSTLLALVTIPVGWIYPEQAWVMPDLKHGLLLVLVGVAGGIGQILLTQSYRYAEASTIAPFDYVNMLWAILFGWLLFADVPGFEVIAGSGIVIAAGIFVIYREHRLGLDRTKDRRASTPSKS